MSGRKAKLLRKAANQATKGRPAKTYRIEEHAKCVANAKDPENPLEVTRKTLHLGVCSRSVYQGLKQRTKRGERDARA